MLQTNKMYIEDLERCANEPLPWESLNGKSILITGATGLIGSFLVDLLMYRNLKRENNVSIYAACRSSQFAKVRFESYLDTLLFKLVIQDVNVPLNCDVQFDYIFNGASNTHPVSYATDPIGTIMTNVLGTYNILDYGAKHNVKRIVQFSTVEIYGQDIAGKEALAETDCGYIDCNTLRAGYPEAKRTAESLCQSFISKYNMDICLARLCRIYGPTMKVDDSKVIAQFIKNALHHEDIVLKSKGEQVFSYCYVADTVTALLYILFFGKIGEAYNVADDGSTVTLADLAMTVSQVRNHKVVFALPSDTEKKGVSVAQRAVLDASKLETLGWQAKVHMQQGVERTIEILGAELLSIEVL